MSVENTMLFRTAAQRNLWLNNTKQHLILQLEAFKEVAALLAPMDDFRPSLEINFVNAKVETWDDGNDIGDAIEQDFKFTAFADFSSATPKSWDCTIVNNTASY